MIYGILDAFRNEIGIRYTDYGKAYKEWKRQYAWQPCFLVRWMTDSWFVVLEPQ